MDLGARLSHLLPHHAAPIAPAIAAGWMLAFTLSLDDLVIASFTTRPGGNDPADQIYSAVRLGLTPEINAACTLMLVAVTVVVVAALLLAKRRDIGGGNSEWSAA